MVATRSMRHAECAMLKGRSAVCSFLFVATAALAGGPHAEGGTLLAVAP